MNSVQDLITLHNGYKIPCVGLGVYRMSQGDDTKRAVLTALREGYRHIDTAAYYGNEKDVGDAIRESGIPREDIFVTTKVWNTERTYDKVLAACQTSLDALGLDYIDLYLVHWPAAKGTTPDWKAVNDDVWRAMEDIYDKGLAKAIGVSNFKTHHLKALMESCSIVPMVNQIEYHPGFARWKTLEFCDEHDIQLEAWAPLGRGRVLDNPVLQQIAKKYDCTVAQVCIRACLQNNVIPLPKSTNPQHMKENADVFRFTISDEDMLKIADLPMMGYSGHDPDTVDF